MSAKKYVAAIIGGSGSVGKNVVKSLLEDSQCTKVILVSRRELDDLKALDPERISVEVCNPLENVTEANVSGANVAFCTVGYGSPRKVSKDDLLKVDATIPGKFAEVCNAAKVSHYCLMTAVGSDEKAEWSSFTRTAAGGGWYNHVKGVAEKLTIEAKIPYTYIAQPGALLGSPHTPKLVGLIPNAVIPLKYSSAHVADIAQGMVNKTINAYQQGKTGIYTISGGIPISEGK